MECEFSQQILMQVSISNFKQIHPLVAKLIHAVRKTRWS